MRSGSLGMKIGSGPAVAPRGGRRRASVSRDAGRTDGRVHNRAGLRPRVDYEKSQTGARAEGGRLPTPASPAGTTGSRSQRGRTTPGSRAETAEVQARTRSVLRAARQ